MVSIVSVAKAAGVSNKTVSRVINGEPHVTEDTRERVEKAIRDLGYVPNMAARQIRSSRSNTFGIITDYVSTTPYSVDIVRGIQDWANTHGKTILMANTGGSSEREAEIWKMFQSHRIDGVLYVTMYHRIVDPVAGDVSVPTVMINCRPQTSELFPSIEPDDFQGARDLTRYLLERGHRRIGYIRLNPVLLGAELRLDAFRQATKEFEVADGDLTIRLGMEGPVGAEENYVFAAATEMLQQKDRPTAIMSGNDEMAIQIYIAAMALGLRIPQDVSIVGFDDFRTVSLALKPELTTAALPYYDLGFQGAEWLNTVVAGDNVRASSRVVSCKLVERNSVRSL
ncbi:MULTISPECIES: LacI family DNA-binding transcriptional regulator [unclassified Rhizobium]|uniref:LacI family DNA-binding transcriptional regulator n=1 Tax=unclassified Rhizobium TaxID=2613769 RepID=UPI001A9877BB|nr:MULTISPECIES: LacI family DNA-binding transcriptional regulator [unclassified Rhizobium]MBX5160954.1 LacI family DNA-binding transcriptional regulator [Rhizobium sp. NZLR8]MBX5165940.1 LacI family DNA-binding transcriptional regulator [Rhizobium sp. NZLR4b]MBX5174247.1 LacI family DNA-binding transcriptional regulator [Rhizobium sp. NZLR1b]MBX5184708.1 LacI family DNA-binding transcriptional regulator [Rhizobium sp. NZLR5]MBX5193460.1 LacI family DNA-binding transcriptional regulator [Rhizo